MLGTITRIAGLDLDQAEILVVDVQGPSSYTTGGEPLVASDLPFRVANQIDSVSGGDQEDGGAGNRAFYDRANDKLLIRDAAGAEVVATTDLSGETYRLTVVGR